MRWLWGLLFALGACCAVACGGGSSPQGNGSDQPPDGVQSSAAAASPSATPVPSGPKPNIVFILSDDQDAASFADMPNVQDLLIEQGTYFPNFIISLPLCCPSRATIMRGQYAHNTGVLKNAPPNGGFATFKETGLENSTIATWLDEAGYRTSLIGKFLNGYEVDQSDPHIPPGWDDWHVFSSGPDYLGYFLNENGKITEYLKTAEDYSTDVFARRATEFIESSGADPFFLMLAPYAPHGPQRPASRDSALFADRTAPRTASFEEADVSDKPAWINVRNPFTEAELADIDNDYRNRLRSLQAVDDLVAQVVATLEKTGQLDNTYIVYTSDNGYHQGEHRITKGKQTPYEETIRVSLAIRGPGIPRGRTLENLAVNTDLGPTFAELGRAEVPAFVDGRSLVPLFGESPPSLETWRKSVLIEKEPGKGKRERDDPKAPGFAGLRMNGLVYIEYDTGERELYDLTKDPLQLTNLVSTTGKATLDRYAAALAPLRDCKAQQCREAEDRPP